MIRAVGQQVVADAELAHLLGRLAEVAPVLLEGVEHADVGVPVALADLPFAAKVKKLGSAEGDDADANVVLGGHVAVEGIGDGHELVFLAVVDEHGELFVHVPSCEGTDARINWKAPLLALVAMLECDGVR